MLRLLRRRQADQKKSIDQLLERCEVPTFPAALMEVLSAIRNSANSIKEVAEHVTADPALVVRVLQTVNSAAYGLGKSVSGIQHACSLMGRSRLESLVLSLAMKEVLPRTASPGFEPDRYWKAAVRRASIARSLAALLHPATQSEAFTAGLLQDLALPLLSHALPDDYGQVLEAWHQGDGGSLCTLENERFGWDHAAVGASLAAKWGFPEYLMGAIEQHHFEAEGAQPAVYLVSLLGEGAEEFGLENLIHVAQQNFACPDSLPEILDDALIRAGELSQMMAL